MNKKNIKVFSLILAATLLFGTISESYAISDNTNKTTKQSKIKKNKKAAKSQAPIQLKTTYNNDIHSAFSLEDCVKIAVENNPTIRASVANAQMYKTKIGQAWANYFPTLSAGIDFSREGAHYSTDRYPSGAMNMTYLPTLSANMLLFDFGKTKAVADSAKRTYEAQEQWHAEELNVVMSSIKVAYYNILFAQAQVKVYEDTVADYALQLRYAESLYKAGKKAKVDVITAEYNLGKAKLNLVKAKNILAVARVELSKIMGIPSYRNYSLTGELGTTKYIVNSEDAIKTAFEIRPELLAAQKTAEAAKLNLRAKRRNFTPDLGLFASYGNNIGSEYDYNSYQFGVGLNYSSLNILKTKKMVDEAKYAYEKASADSDSIKNTVYYNVAKSFLELKTAEDAIIISKLALDEATEQYRQVTGRYKAGVGDIISLKDGETTYLNARLDFYNALLNYNVTAATLEKEIGVPLVASDEKVLKNMPKKPAK